MEWYLYWGVSSTNLTGFHQHRALCRAQICAGRLRLGNSCVLQPCCTRLRCRDRWAGLPLQACGGSLTGLRSNCCCCCCCLVQPQEPLAPLALSQPASGQELQAAPQQLSLDQCSSLISLSFLSLCLSLSFLLSLTLFLSLTSVSFLSLSLFLSVSLLYICPSVSNPNLSFYSFSLSQPPLVCVSRSTCSGRDELPSPHYSPVSVAEGALLYTHRETGPPSNRSSLYYRDQRSHEHTHGTLS